MRGKRGLKQPQTCRPVCCTAARDPSLPVSIL